MGLGGSGQDSMTLAVAHAERRDDVIVAMLDALREIRPPFSPQSVVSEFCEAISYEVSEKPKSDLYRELVPLLNSRNVELLDHPRMATQFVALERRTNRGSGKDVINQPLQRRQAFICHASKRDQREKCVLMTENPPFLVGRRRPRAISAPYPLWSRSQPRFGLVDKSNWCTLTLEPEVVRRIPVEYRAGAAPWPSGRSIAIT